MLELESLIIRAGKHIIMPASNWPQMARTSLCSWVKHYNMWSKRMVFLVCLKEGCLLGCRWQLTSITMPHFFIHHSSFWEWCSLYFPFGKTTSVRCVVVIFYAGTYIYIYIVNPGGVQTIGHKGNWASEDPLTSRTYFIFLSCRLKQCSLCKGNKPMIFRDCNPWTLDCNVWWN